LLHACRSDYGLPSPLCTGVPIGQVRHLADQVTVRIPWSYRQRRLARLAVLLRSRRIDPRPFFVGRRIVIGWNRWRDIYPGANNRSSTQASARVNSAMSWPVNSGAAMASLSMMSTIRSSGSNGGSIIGSASARLGCATGSDSSPRLQALAFVGSRIRCDNSEMYVVRIPDRRPAAQFARAPQFGRPADSPAPACVGAGRFAPRIPCPL
jgi:hypothetical protein